MDTSVTRYGVEVDLSRIAKVGCPRCMKHGKDVNKDNLHTYGLDAHGRHKGGYI